MTLHVLVAKMTWGAEPFSDSQVDSTMRAAATFFVVGSFGQVSLSYAQTPWLKVLSGPQACGFADARSLGVRLTRLVAAAGYRPGSYDRLVFLLPSANCDFAGVYEPTGTILNGVLETSLVVHELGESLGMGDAGTLSCRYTGSRRFCNEEGYNAWDVMSADLGGPAGDFGALQKARAGWLRSITHVRSPGVYTLGALEQSTGVPQALVIQTAGFQYWVDHREALGNDAYLASQGDVITSFLVHREVGDPDLSQNREYPLIPDYLLPQARYRYITAPGQSFILPNIFQLTALTHRGRQMTIRFRWLDHTRPARPVVTVTRPAASTISLSWPSVPDTGTGVEKYLVSIDDKAPATIPAEPARTTYHDQATGLSPGHHTLTITAVDYAGNHSPSATETITIG